jgi:chromosome segregation ATPase
VVVAGEAELLREALHRAREELSRRTTELSALEQVVAESQATHHAQDAKVQELEAGKVVMERRLKRSAGELRAAQDDGALAEQGSPQGKSHWRVQALQAERADLEGLLVSTRGEVERMRGDASLAHVKGQEWGAEREQLIARLDQVTEAADALVITRNELEADGYRCREAAGRAVSRLQTAEQERCEMEMELAGALAEVESVSENTQRRVTHLRAEIEATQARCQTAEQRLTQALSEKNTMAGELGKVQEALKKTIDESTNRARTVQELQQGNARMEHEGRQAIASASYELSTQTHALERARADIEQQREGLAVAETARADAVNARSTAGEASVKAEEEVRLRHDKMARQLALTKEDLEGKIHALQRCEEHLQRGAAQIIDLKLQLSSVEADKEREESDHESALKKVTGRLAEATLGWEESKAAAATLQQEQKTDTRASTGRLEQELQQARQQEEAVNGDLRRAMQREKESSQARSDEEVRHAAQMHKVGAEVARLESCLEERGAVIKEREGQVARLTQKLQQVGIEAAGADRMEEALTSSAQHLTAAQATSMEVCLPSFCPLSAPFFALCVSFVCPLSALGLHSVCPLGCTRQGKFTPRGG